jgi:3-hydroxyisobutyrate dehydrogenase-like beta-hydroxyacid dehydrogenase
MARTLLKAGHRVTVYNRTRSRAEALQAEGAVVADSPAAACRGEAVITMLADDNAVEEVVFGSGNMIDALHDDTIHVSMSTITVALSERLTEAHRDAGRQYLAAPVFGRPDAAAAGKLFIVAAGEQQALARCQAIFDVLGQRTFVVGEKPPAANLVKLSGNFLIASVIECLGETVALMRKSGVDPRCFVDILTNSLFAAPIYKTYGDLIVEEKYQPPGFRMPLGLKDIRSVLAAAEAKAVPMPVASLVRDHFISGIARGGADLDWSGLARVVAENAGL